MPITTCTRCGRLYEERSEEDANSPGRQCVACYEESKGPYCRDCGGGKLSFMGTYAESDWWKCKECNSEFVW